MLALPLDVQADFTPIAVCGCTPVVLVVNPNVPARDAKDLITLLKARPDGSTCGSSRAGTILHLATAMFLDETDTKARHIPFKGVGPMVTDLLGGHVDFATAALSKKIGLEAQ